MRRIATVVLVGVLWIVSASPASAQSDGDPFLSNGADSVDPPSRPDSFAGCVGSGSCFAGVAVGEEGSGPGSGANPCVYEVYGAAEVVIELWLYFWPLGDPGVVPDLGGVETPGAEAAAETDLWVLVLCPNDIWGAGSLVPVAIVPLGDPPDPDAMRRVAEQAIALPIPEPEFSPRAENRQLLGLETWIWLDDAQTVPVSATACVGPQDYACVAVTATFVDIAADMGDGSDIVVCDGAGREYLFDVAPERQRDLPHCGYLYTESPEDSEFYEVTVAGTWRVSYSCRYDPDLDGTYPLGCGGGSLGFIARATAPIPLEILDLQAVAIPND